MFRNYFKIAVRNLLKYKFYSVINILGLSIGIAAFLFIFLYVQDELSYDRYHQYADQIVRVDFHARLGDNETHAAQNTAPAGPMFAADYPEIEAFCRFRSRGSFLVKYEENHYKERKIIYADSSFFQFFSIPLISGDAKKALAEPNAVVLNQRMAKKYFGTQDPIGKTLLLNNNRSFKITGVMENIPTNTHFDFDFLLSMGSLEESRSENWGSINFSTYFLMKEGIDLVDFENKLQLSLRQYFEPVIQQYVGSTWEEFIGSGNFALLDVVKLTDIHLHSDKTEELAANGDIRYVYVFGVIGLFILLIASINFVNLSTARSVTRSKEVGVRKVVGAQKANLIRQFLSESILTALVALFLAYGILYLALPWFNDISGKSLQMSSFSAPNFVFMALGLGLLTGVLSGIYPSFILSGFQPVSVLKSHLKSKQSGNLFRNSLVVFQFFITTLLIVFTLVVFRQLQYMQNKKLGYNKDQVLVVNDAFALGENTDAFKQKMLSYPAVKHASVTGFTPVNIDANRNTSSYFRGTNATQENAILIANWRVDFDYVKTMGMQIVQGRDFDQRLSTDSTAIIINEELARQLAYEDPIGKKMSGFIDNTGENMQIYDVIGVVKNFHFSSLRDAIGPLALFIGNSRGAISMRLEGSEVGDFIYQLESDWKAMAPNQPFSYQFLDERFSRMFTVEQQLGKIAGVFAFLAIFIACIGLLGLATFIAQQRTKEIGIRKVLGASIPTLVYLLCKDFGKLILIAFLIAIPVSWYFMNQWLADFAFATSIGVGVFLLAGVLIMAMTLLSVLYQSTRVALVNPVDTLKYE